jgi:hypothetical protein
MVFSSHQMVVLGIPVLLDAPHLLRSGKEPDPKLLCEGINLSGKGILLSIILLNLPFTGSYLLK